MSASELWDHLLAPEDRQRLGRAKFGRRVGWGRAPAIIVIDAQRYMAGEGEGPSDRYPSACPTAPAAIAHVQRVVTSARQNRVPVFYTKFVLKPDGSDAGVYARKRELLDIDGWCLEGTSGAEIVPQLQPAEQDVVLVKKKPSAFLGTPLLGMLIDRGVDTLIVTGGSTSNCVRATAVDAASYNYRVVIPHDCVFDRVDLSHRVALFDMDRQYADVVASADVLKGLATLGEG